MVKPHVRTAHRVGALIVMLSASKLVRAVLPARYSEQSPGACAVIAYVSEAPRSGWTVQMDSSKLVIPVSTTLPSANDPNAFTSTTSPTLTSFAPLINSAVHSVISSEEMTVYVAFSSLARSCSIVMSPTSLNCILMFSFGSSLSHMAEETGENPPALSPYPVKGEPLASRIDRGIGMVDPEAIPTGAMISPRTRRRQ